MPQWIHDRAEHILAKNPSMDKGTAFAVATQQSHAKGKSPKGYGTRQGKREAKQKYDTPKGDEGTANPGKLDSPKMPGKPKEASAPDIFSSFFKVAKDILPGGLADDKDDRDFDPGQLEEGEQVELEHVDNPELAREIARDHLVEHPEYYKALKKMEDELEGKEAMPRALYNLHLFTKNAFLAGDNDSSLKEQVGKTKVRTQKAVSPDPKFRVKQAMIPASPYTAPGNPQTKLVKSQKIGTPDDPGMGVRPLNQIKPPKPPSTEGSMLSSRSAQFKLGSVQVARDLFKKLAFSASGFGDTGGMWRPNYVSGLDFSPPPSLGVLDPHIKEGGNKVKKALMTKTSFSQSGFGKTTTMGYGTHGNAGFDASGQGGMPPPSLGVLDPHLKYGGSQLREQVKKAVALGPQGRLAEARREGKPKQTGFAGPSIADVSKPVGFGKPMPGATKNRI